MKTYLQYKAFKNMDDLNEWLKNFVNNPFDKENKQYVWNNGSRCYVLGNIQFLGQAEVGGTDEQIDGSASFYPVASYLVGDATL